MYFLSFVSSLDPADVDYQHAHQVRQAGADQVWPGDEGTHREGSLDQGVLQLPKAPHRQVHNPNEQGKVYCFTVTFLLT